MSTYTDLHKKMLKETINVNYDDRLTEQKLRLSNDQNEYWGSFYGKADIAGATISGGSLLSVYIQSLSSNLSNAIIENGIIHNVILSDDEQGEINLGQLVADISSKVLSIDGFDSRLTAEMQARVANDNFLSSQIDLKEDASNATQEYRNLRSSINSVDGKILELSASTKALSSYIISQISTTSSFIEDEAKQISSSLSSQISASSFLLSAQLKEVSSFIRRDEAIVSSYTFDNISAVSSYLIAHSSDLSGDTLSALSSLSIELSAISSDILTDLSTLSANLSADAQKISSDVQFLLSANIEGMCYKGILEKMEGEDLALSAFIGQQCKPGESTLKLGNFYGVSAEQSALYDADFEQVSFCKNDFFVLNRDVQLSDIRAKDIAIIGNAETKIELLRQDLTLQVSCVSSFLLDQMSCMSSDLSTQLSSVSSDLSNAVSCLNDSVSAISVDLSAAISSLDVSVSAISCALSTEMSAVSSYIIEQISATSSQVSSSLLDEISSVSSVLSALLSSVSADLLSTTSGLSIEVSAVSAILSSEISSVSSYIIEQISATSSYQAEEISGISSTLCSLVSSEYFILSADNNVSGNQVFAGSLSVQALSVATASVSSFSGEDATIASLSVQFDKVVDDINGIPLANRIKQQENPSLVSFAQQINKMIACAGLDPSKAIDLEEDLLAQLKSSIIYIYEVAGCETPIDDDPTIGQAGQVIEEALNKLTFVGTHITLQQCLDDLSCNIDNLAYRAAEVTVSCEVLSTDLSAISADLAKRIDNISGDFGKVSADVYESAKASFVWLSGDNTTAHAHAISGANDFTGELFAKSLSVAQLKGIGNGALALGTGSFAIGTDVSAKAANAFAWNGESSPYIVPEENEGTFCINPVGELEGVYVGTKSISAHLSNAIETPTKKIEELSAQLSAIADAIRNDGVLSNGISENSNMQSMISAMVLIFSKLSAF